MESFGNVSADESRGTRNNDFHHIASKIFLEDALMKLFLNACRIQYTDGVLGHVSQ
jgi:hypothetical protein